MWHGRLEATAYLCNMIDLRSDTLTVPTDEMREAMAAAVVGDDVYSEDPTIEVLQERVAALFGKEAALFVPSGTMGNQLCLALHTQAGDEVIADADAHIFHYENAAASVLARVQLHCVRSHDGAMPYDAIREAIRPTAYYNPRTSLIAVENTHNRHGGTVVSMDYLRGLRRLADEVGLPLHCDGARLWNAMAATGTSAAEYGTIFDTLSVCMSKGAGAPVGSLVIGSRVMIERARRWRKMLGGGMRQAGVLAAAAIHALDTIVPLLPNDHRRARAFADGLAQVPGVAIDLDRVQSNIVAFRIPGIGDAAFVDACAGYGVRLATIRPGVFRAVWYHQITDTMTNDALEAVRMALGHLLRDHSPSAS